MQLNALEHLLASAVNQRMADVVRRIVKTW